mgnify:CR=1 FL=1
MQKNNAEYVMGSSSNFVNDVMLYNNLGAGSVYNKPESNATQWSLMSYLARINYTLKHKYLFSVNARVDGSSRFGTNNKYGFFPSGAIAWRISQENSCVMPNGSMKSNYAPVPEKPNSKHW